MEVLRTEENGIEFFTVVKTGESGLSQRGLAKASGKRVSTIQNLVINLTDEAPSKWLKSFVGIDLNLTDGYRKKGGLVKIYKSDFCVAVIKHYAYLGSETAQDFDIAIASIGLASYIQTKTGWLPEQYKASPDSHQAINRILDKAAPWERLYDENRNKGFKWFGYRFYNDYIYSFFTAEEWAKINRLNPVRKEANGRCDRLQRIHQYIEPATKDRLRDTVATVLGFVDVSNTPEEFQELYRRKYGRIEQLSLPLNPKNH